MGKKSGETYKIGRPFPPCLVWRWSALICPGLFFPLEQAKPYDIEVWWNCNYNCPVSPWLLESKMGYLKCLQLYFSRYKFARIGCYGIEQTTSTSKHPFIWGHIFSYCSTIKNVKCSQPIKHHATSILIPQYQTMEYNMRPSMSYSEEALHSF